MKKILAILLALLTVVSMVPAVSAAEPVTASDEIATLDDTPSSFTLVNDGTGALPPIDNQGQIGSCVGQSVTYMQFSNAVARYMQSKGHTDWKPNDGSAFGDDRYLFSPKWTLNYSGAGTQWVYDILMHMGVPNQTLSKFEKTGHNSSSYYTYSGGSRKLYTKTTSWDVTGDVMQQALNIRLNDYDQIWTRDVGGGQVTNSTAGKAFIERIKQSLMAGNVVVTGGASGKWGYTSRTDSVGKLTGGGSIGKAGEYCVFAAQGNYGGGHQVSIVGWDDNVTYTIGGVTLRGAFLVANSWDTTWMNGGYIWFMYDSINKRSEFANECPALALSTRDYALDQFVFTDWKTGISVGYPDLMISADVTTADRESTSLYLTRTDKATGETASYQPVIFYYGDLGVHEDYDVKSPDYLNYAGEKNGTAATAHFTFSYEDLYTKMPAGKTVNDYVWGFRLQVKSGSSATVGNVKLEDKNLNTLFQKNFNITVNADGAPAQAFISCSENSYIITDDSTKYTIKPYGGSVNPVPAGGSYSFTVEPAKGFSLAHAKVVANGQVLYPVNGVYTLTNVQSSAAISVSGVVEDVSSKTFYPSMYNGDGWEYYGNQYIMVVSISGSSLRKDIYANPAELGTPDYPYYFRFTDNETGISYYMQPSSIYDFDANSASSTVLYRLPFLEAGFSAVLDKVYNFTLDIVYKGNVLYTGQIRNTKCSLTDDNNDSSKNPPQKNSDTVKPASAPHYVSYYLNGKLVGTDAFLKNSSIVKRSFTPSAENYTIDFTPNLPAVMGEEDISVSPYAVYAMGDITEDSVFNIKDITRLCLYLGDSAVVCDKGLVDANKDGKVQIDDVSFLLSKLAATVTVK